MLDEENPDLEKSADEPYEDIKEYELKTRELKEDFKKALERTSRNYRGYCRKV
jgi:hypothetical protein